MRMRKGWRTNIVYRNKEPEGLSKVDQIILLLALHCSPSISPVVIKVKEEKLTFRNTTQEMFMAQFIRSLPQRNHPSLDANSLKLRPIKLVRAPRKLFEVDVGGGGHLPGVDLEDARTSALVGEREFDFAVQTSRTEEGRVEDVDSVRSCYYLQQ